MKLKKFKFPKRRRSKKNAETDETATLKCLLLGPNIAVKDTFLDISGIAMYIMLIRIGWPEEIILRLLAKKAQEGRLLN